MKPPRDLMQGQMTFVTSEARAVEALIAAMKFRNQSFTLGQEHLRVLCRQLMSDAARRSRGLFERRRVAPAVSQAKRFPLEIPRPSWLGGGQLSLDSI